MANFVFNRSKGRTTEFFERVLADDPANSVIVVDLLASSGVESDATLKDKDDFSALVSGATNFATGTGWGRYTLNQASGITTTYDDTNDQVICTIPDHTYTAVADAADDVGDVVTGYDSDSTGGTDSGILPMTQHDWVIQPDGSDVTLDVGANGILVSS